MLEALNRFARLASARSEVVGASLILLMVTMMVLPLNSMILDVLIALNICAAILLVITAVLLETPLAFSSFPAVLLMTTLFRLALTISTTRQILLEADAGMIIQTFGEFVVGGNIAVGLVIFLIISVVNFLVVTKGSERVAEVAARFSLDGMPGKQMSIDSDLRAGLITQAVAKKRRSDLEKESQLFGAMDGAIKFVKNDAIAGLIITIVNLLGGLSIGMLQKDMTFAEAGHIYSILSVGDGLVGIIPSLLVSIAAGLIVTRVTKGESDGANTAQDIFRDFSANNKALQISGIFCFFFAAVPGMPSIVFILAGMGLFAAWYFVPQKNESGEVKSAGLESRFNDMTANDADSKMEDLNITETYSALEVCLPEKMEPGEINRLKNILRLARNRKIESLGVLIPQFDFRTWNKPEIELFVYGIPAMTINWSDKRLALLCTAEEFAKLSGIEASLEKDKTTGVWEYLCEPALLTRINNEKIPHLTFEARVMRRMEMLLIKKMAQLFTLNEYQKHITSLGESFAEQLKELERVLPATKVVDVLQRLLVESISIKNMRSILNALIEWGQKEREPRIIGEQTRRELSEQICYQHAESGALPVFMIGVELEQIVRESSRSNGATTYLDIDSSSMSDIIRSIEEALKPWLGSNRIPALVSSMDCRPHIREMIEDSLFSVPVLSYQEVTSNIEIQVLGTVNLPEVATNQ